jgi:predicted dehydrogenase
MKESSVDRRDFLRTMAAGLTVFFTEEELMAARVYPPLSIDGPPVKFGLVGAGQWGREILSTLSRLQTAQVTSICDTYEPYLKRGVEVAPKAATVTDYRKLLESAEVEAVIVATPTHLHKEIALAALQAGKHLYCEAPLAGSIEDAKAIATAAQQASKVKFQAGLQGRSNALYRHVLQFVRSGVLGSQAMISGQWNKKQSWRRTAPTNSREAQVNWRLMKDTSTGLAGEVAIHQFDFVDWYLKTLPTAVTGFGSINNWRDGREIPDTIQAVLEYPNNVRMIFNATLASSFSDAFTLFQGADSSLMMRENRGWLVKEADSPLLGWEVYARKENIHNETGICMVADSTKLIEEGKEPGKEGALEPTQTALSLAMQNFISSIREDKPTACGPVDGFNSTVVAIKTNEAVMSGSKIIIPNQSYLSI